MVANTPAYLLAPDVIFVDGGFGKPPALSPTIPPRIPTPAPGFGDGTFKAPPLIEAAITAPNFHNNSAPTIEAAVNFYASPEFNSPNPIIFLSQDKATAIASLLRSLGAMELMDRSIQNDNSAIDGNILEGRDFINTAIKNTTDAIKVLKEGNYLLYPTVQNQLLNVQLNQCRALLSFTTAKRDGYLQQANQQLTSLKNAIAQ